jgi:TDG/mug DNA glycosylase family protein
MTGLPGLPDILAKNLSVVFCGINPGMTAAVAGHHFSSASNRFWKIIHLAGFTPVQILPRNDRSILEYGCGLTTAVARPTRRADELSATEFSSAASALKRKLAYYKPRAVVFLGKAAFSALTKAPAISWGRQAQAFAGASAWVVPNPSGLNRGFSVDELARWYREARLGIAHRLPR